MQLWFTHGGYGVDEAHPDHDGERVKQRKPEQREAGQQKYAHAHRQQRAPAHHVLGGGGGTQTLLVTRTHDLRVSVILR